MGHICLFRTNASTQNSISLLTVTALWTTAAIFLLSLVFHSCTSSTRPYSPISNFRSRINTIFVLQNHEYLVIHKCWPCLFLEAPSPSFIIKNQLLTALSSPSTPLGIKNIWCIASYKHSPVAKGFNQLHPTIALFLGYKIYITRIFSHP